MEDSQANDGWILNDFYRNWNEENDTIIQAYTFFYFKLLKTILKDPRKARILQSWDSLYIIDKKQPQVIQS